MTLFAIQPYCCARSVRLLPALLWILFFASSDSASGLLADDFHKLDGKHIQLVTDLPVDDSIRELTAVFDAAMPEWCRYFGVDPSETTQWKTTACLMLERQRFKAAGLLPDTLPNFPHGFQFNDDLWVVEQPSQYYRRHLLLHEGTHWFMFRKFGSAGPPWLMEGMAELLATHRWQDGQLQMGVIPRSGTDVPFWGRISLINQQLNDGLAPSLETILRYDTRAHQSTDAYAWSWAAVVFFDNNPSTRKQFRELFTGRLRNDETPTRELLRAIQPRRSLIRAEWAAMLTGLDYGFVPQRELVQLDHRAKALEGSTTMAVSATRGWQPTGITVAPGHVISVEATGRFQVGKTSKPWLCEADGVTLKYVNGQPLGKLIMAVAEPQTKEPEFSERLTTIPVGSRSTITIERAGQLLIRINDNGAGLDDNIGELQVKFSRQDTSR